MYRNYSILNPNIIMFAICRVYRYGKATENMVDAYGTMNTELSERMLAEKVLLSPTPDHNLVKRVLTHVAVNEKAPSEVCTY